MAEDNDADVDIVSSLKETMDGELKGTYTATMAIVEEVDEKTRRVVASLKKNPDVFVGDVPIATTFSEDGGGMITPIAKEDEGILLHTKESLYGRTDTSGPVPDETERHHTLEDAVLMPRFWLGDQTIPPHDAGEWKVVVQDVPRKNKVAVQSIHPDGRVTSLTLDKDGNVASRIDVSNDGTVSMQVSDAGTPQVTLDIDASQGTFNVELNQDGMNIALGGSSVFLGDPKKAKAALNEDAEFNDTFLGLFGGGVKKTGTEHTNIS